MGPEEFSDSEEISADLGRGIIKQGFGFDIGHISYFICMYISDIKCYIVLNNCMQTYFDLPYVPYINVIWLDR